VQLADQSVALTAQFAVSTRPQLQHTRLIIWCNRPHCALSRDGTRVLVDQQRLTGAGLGKRDLAVVTIATGAVVNLTIPSFTPGAWVVSRLPPHDPRPRYRGVPRRAPTGLASQTTGLSDERGGKWIVVDARRGAEVFLRW
jgi:hypothetical protein